MLCIIMYFAVKSDLSCRQIPDECSLAICILAAGCGGFSLSRVTFSLGILLLLGLVTGFGDAKLFGALGLLLGNAVFPVIALSFILAGIYCTLAIVIGKIKGSKGLRFSDSIAFAPFIAAPAIAVFMGSIFATYY